MTNQVLFPALNTPLIVGNPALAPYTWQQQFIEWKQQLMGFPIGLPFIQYGTGAPTVAGAENCIYMDTTGSPYHGYIYHAGAWHPFS